MFANALSGVIYFKIGARLGLSFSLIFSMIGSIVLVYLFKINNQEYIPIFISVGKMGIAAALNMCFIANMQLIPTIFSATIFGLCNVMARLMTILAP